MGRPEPQPKSIIVAPGGSVRAQSRTALAPMAVEGARPRPARNSTATPSYPLDRSVIDRTLSVAKGLTPQFTRPRHDNMQATAQDTRLMRGRALATIRPKSATHI